MATDGRRQAPSIGEQLEARGGRFDFFQAVALVERDAPWAASAGTSPSPQREAVSLRASISMAFPTADVEEVERLDAKKVEITASFLSLAGALGPLPPPDAELVARRALAHDTALRDFLDIFHHRLLSIFYRIRKRHRVGLGVRSPVDGEVAHYLFSILGLGTPGLQRRLGVPDRALLHHAGVLARPVRTMAGLEVILSGHFGVRVSGRPLTGRLCTIEPDDRTAIGPTGRRRSLGREAMIGRQVWIQDAAFELSIGPLSSADLRRFLPGGDTLPPLCAMIDFYVGDVTSYSLRLLAEPGTVDQARLGSRHGARLGYTTWLGPPRALRERGGREREIRLSFTTLAPYRASEARPPDSAERATP